jgi:hypothetical protein
METMWYFGDGGTRRGPVSTADLLTALNAMPDARTTYVWRQGMADWQHAGMQPELSGQLLARVAPAVAPPPVAQPAPSAPAGQARAVAVLYRRLVLLIGVQLLIAFATNALSSQVPALTAIFGALSFVGAIVVFFMLVITTYRLMTQLGSRAPVLWALAMIVPLLNILFLLMISAKAQAWCKQRGIKVGLLGPTKESLERFGARDTRGQ